MNTLIIVDESKLNLPLRTVVAGVLSSLDATVRGVPEDASAVGVLFEYLDGTKNFRAECSRGQEPGEWTCYANPYVFPEESTDGSLHYHVVATDAQGNPCWLGTGQLRVLECPAAGSSDVPEVLPRDTYIRNPVTGLYHLLTATVDEDGNMTLNLAEEGLLR